MSVSLPHSRPPTAERDAQRLSSWKEIAAYLGVAVRTVQRWERTVGLPVRRRPGERRDAVYAFAPELDNWWEQREPGANTPEASQAKAVTPSAWARPSVAGSIGVLPFVNMNGDEDGEFFCDGITEDIINALTRVEGLRVAPRSAAFQFKGRNPQIREVAEKLKVSAVLEGSVRRSDKKLRVTAELVDVAAGYPVWSARYDRVMKDVFDIQDEISRAIVENLKIQWVSEQRERLIKRYTANLEAYNAYLKGRFYWNQRTPESIAKAIGYFQQALAEDSAYALAQAGVADCHAAAAAYGTSLSHEVMPKAKAEALQALATDETLAEAHTSLAFVTAVYEHRWEEAEKEFRRAIELYPNHPQTHSWLAWFVLMPTGRMDEAAAHAKRACDLDPVDPINALGMSMLYYLQRRFDEALTESKKALELNPTHPLANYVLALEHVAVGDYGEAIAACERIKPPYFGAGFLGYSYAASGRKHQARKVLERLRRDSRTRYVPAIASALTYLGLKEWDQAFECLERTCEERSPTIVWLDFDQLYDPIRTDPRFAALLTKLNLRSS